MRTQFFELARVNGVVYGYPIEGKTKHQLKATYDDYFDLSGREYLFFLVTSDNSIGRADALAFATCLATGKAIQYSIDLSQLTSERKKWTPK